MKTKVTIFTLAIFISILLSVPRIFANSTETEDGQKIMRDRSYSDTEAVLERSRRTRREVAPRQNRMPASIEEAEEFDENKLLKDIDGIIEEDDTK